MGATSRPTRHLFLSPHLDDAVLSCGGTIAALAERGEDVVVVTACAGGAVPPYSPVAALLHDLWELHGDIVARRRSEDRAAVALLGAEAQHGDIPDAIYRKDVHGNWLYAERDALSGPPPEDDAWIVPRIEELVKGSMSGPTRLYAPLAIGGHPDHRLAHSAARELQDEGIDVIYFEDFPYARHEERYRARLSELPGWSSLTVGFEERHLRLKADAIRLYASQLGMLSEAGDVVAGAIAYARAARDGHSDAAERQWRSP